MKYYAITARLVLLEKDKPPQGKRRYYVETGLVTALAPAGAISKAKHILEEKFDYVPLDKKKEMYATKKDATYHEKGWDAGAWVDFQAIEVKAPVLYGSWKELIDAIPPSRRSFYRIWKDTAACAKELEEYFARHASEDNQVAEIPVDCDIPAFIDIPIFINGELAITEHNLYLAVACYDV